MAKTKGFVGKLAILSGFDDERDGMVVKIMSEHGTTAIIQSTCQRHTYRANLSKRRLELLEEGAAGFNAELSKGFLTVTHSEDKTVLVHRPIVAGTWKKLWRILDPNESRKR